MYFAAGGEDNRPGGWSSAEPSRRMHSGPIVTSGILSKQKNPAATDHAIPRDAMVSIFFCAFLC